MTLSIHKLSAGTGYEYLTRQVAVSDSTEVGQQDMSDYYAAKGEAPGSWVGRGLVGLESVAAGDLVTADQMRRLFGGGSDPTSGTRLGRPYRVFDNALVREFSSEVSKRVTQRVDGTIRTGEVAATRSAARTEVARELFEREHGRPPTSVRELDAALKRYSRPPRQAVAGFDLTFSPVKSVSTLWAVAPPEVAAVIEGAHRAAIDDALAWVEGEALFTREGLNGARQVETQGMIATAFTHRDSRAGDPDLHTHVAVANKVQTKEGEWLSIYGRVLYESVVAASETYNTALEHHLAEGLGVQFADRPGAGREKRPVREIIGVDPALNEAWSTRRRDIDLRRGELATDFQLRHGRPPTNAEAIALAQQANLETREAKHEPRALAEQRAAWRAEAIAVLGDGHAVDLMVDRAMTDVAAPLAPSKLSVADAAARVISELELRRATWKVTHVRAEAMRQVRGHSTSLIIDDIVTEVIDQLSVTLTPDLDPVHDPAALRRDDGLSVYRHPGRDRFTSQRIIDAERLITDAAGRGGCRTASDSALSLALLESTANGAPLNRGQRDLVTAFATSGRQVQVAIAPAGSGKTTAMRALAAAWSEEGGTVLGIAPSAAAAAALEDEAGIDADTIAKLVHDLDSGRSTRIGPDTLLVVDEAGMAGTLELARVIDHALGRGAAVRLIGDDRQLSAVAAGGVLRDIARQHGAVRLGEVMRFENPAEAEASLHLRDGDPSCLGFYLDHDRVHIGNPASCADAVFTAWSADRDAGLDALMLAPTRDMVVELNRRAREARLGGSAPPSQTRLSDGNLASVGDVVITRRNDRRLSLSDTDWVKNGDRWMITALGGVTAHAVHLVSGMHVALPASYVAEHVELGYATTVHAAQGQTVDVVHGILTGTEDRAVLYTMLTRGRRANHVHLATAPVGDAHALAHIDSSTITATETLEAILARDATGASATTTAREGAAPRVLLHEAAARYADALAFAAEDHAGPARTTELRSHAEHLVPGIADTPSWPALAAHLSLIDARGLDAHTALSTAVRYRSLDDAEDPGTVVSWRLHLLHPSAAPGPAADLPPLPPLLRSDPTWGTYLAQRATRVTDLAAEVSAQADHQTWKAHGMSLPDHLVNEIEIWRAVHGVPEDDRRPLGPPLADLIGLEHQRQLERRIDVNLDPAMATWTKAIVDAVGRRDPQAPVLAARLMTLAKDGHDVPKLLTTAMASGPLPDDHATAALDSRLTQILGRRPADSRSRRQEERRTDRIRRHHPSPRR